ncbi:MAG: hypothetical protein K2N30_05125 [Clostridia bacterium]|nr:hypothetical protein [Clostridia bacterium]
MIKVGIFWAIPDKVIGQSALEVHKSYCESEANSLGFINYPYSHYEVWDGEVKGLGDDCYRYPRGRVIYDAKRGKHKIFADKCISQLLIDEIAELLEIKNYKLCRDGHYVCPKCQKKKEMQNERNGKEKNI